MLSVRCPPGAVSWKASCVIAVAVPVIVAVAIVSSKMIVSLRY